MEDPALDFVLEEALNLLDAGEAPEAIIARFPDAAAKLLPLLNVASTLKETAEDAIEVPMDKLHAIGEFLQDKFEDVIERRSD